MLFDFHDINYFTMTYIFKEDDGDLICEYEQTQAPTQVTPDSQSITFTLKNIDPNEDDEEYIATLIKEGDEEYYLKSTYFEDASELYPLNVDLFDEEVRFTSVSADEVMYLSAFLE